MTTGPSQLLRNKFFTHKHRDTSFTATESPVPQPVPLSFIPRSMSCNSHGDEKLKLEKINITIKNPNTSAYKNKLLCNSPLKISARNFSSGYFYPDRSFSDEKEQTEKTSSAVYHHQFGRD